jgi:hypothetical protein
MVPRKITPNQSLKQTAAAIMVSRVPLSHSAAATAKRGRYLLITKGDIYLDRQSQNELRVFKKFAEVCPYGSTFDSIEKRQPPEPDILCRLSDGKEIAFEIVECIDNSLARSIYDSCELGKAFSDEIEKLPEFEKQRIKSIFGDVLISVSFQKDMSLMKKRSTVKLIFDHLWAKENEAKVPEMDQSFSFLSPQESQQFFETSKRDNITEAKLLKQPPYSKDVVKQFDLKLPKNLRDVVKRITFFFPGPSGGPSFDITEAIWFANPIEKQIDKKMKKKYETKCRAELLVYYELQPELPAEYWILPAMDSVVENLEQSAFERVWLYSVTQNEVIYVYPDVASQK